MKKIIFLDRDGVINEDLIGDYIKRWEDFKFIPGAVESLKKLSRAGYEIVIISNQAGIGDGEYPESALNEITEKMKAELLGNQVAIGKVYYCTHGKKAGCHCRKPKTGLFELAEKDYQFDRPNTYYIGDKVSDMEAGRAFGLKTIFVLTGHGINHQHQFSNDNQPDRIFPSIAEAVAFIVKES